MKRMLIFWLIVGLNISACTDRDDDLSAVNIRIKNTSTVVFDEVLVGDETHIYADLNSDSFSEYLEYETAYQYAYIQITSGEEVYVLQPIDFVGETPLPVGLYTYELDITEEGEVLLEFRID